MDGIYLTVVMIVTGGAIAFIGDKLGTKIGKKRLSIFGLRPRHTSMVITVLTGALITGLSIGAMTLASKNVRTALFGMEELNAAMASTKEALNAATVDLLQMQEEFRHADEELGSAREEITKLKSEQEELAEESERLKDGNLRLEEEKATLTEQNENLVGINENLTDTNAKLSNINATLESDNKKLSEFNIKLTNDNEKLSKDNAELEERTQRLREGLIVMREGDIVFKAGEILASSVIQSNRSPEEIAADINIIADEASRNIAERFGDNSDSTVWIYQPEFQQAVEDIIASGQNTVLRIIAAGNLIRGEPIRTRIAMFPNNLVYKVGERVFLGEYEVASDTDSDAIVKDFFGNVNQSAVAKGILADPITGTVGVMEGTQLYELVDEIESVRGKIRLTANAREDTYSIGPLRLNIQIQQEIRQ